VKLRPQFFSCVINLSPAVPCCCLHVTRRHTGPNYHFFICAQTALRWRQTCSLLTPRDEDVWEDSGCAAPRILNFHARWRCDRNWQFSKAHCFVNCGRLSYSFLLMAIKTKLCRLQAEIMQYHNNANFVT
jgi:hypothetical protein